MGKDLQWPGGSFGNAALCKKFSLFFFVFVFFVNLENGCKTA